jgi:hypothetical protein
MGQDRRSLERDARGGQIVIGAGVELWGQIMFPVQP